MTAGENKNYNVPKSYSGCFNTVTKADYAHKKKFKETLQYSDLVSPCVMVCYFIVNIYFVF